MPIFDYKCTKCKHEFELYMNSHKDPNPKCDFCESQTVRRKFNSVSIDMNGYFLATPRKKADLESNGARIL